MVRCIFASLLCASVQAARVEVHGHVDNQATAQLEALTRSGLNADQAQQAHRAMQVLEDLKSGGVSGREYMKLEEEYKSLVGDVEWDEQEMELSEEEFTKLKGALDDKSFPGAAPPVLGETVAGNTEMTLAEMLSGNDNSWFTTRLGRFFTGRRDFAVEPSGGGATKYMIDGTGLSLHSRMHVSIPAESPRYVIRRAFNYLNPVATTVGQFMYRVMACLEESGGWSGGCREGDYLYTITKDRLGRGALWGRDEWRVFTGQGGCRRHGYGVLWCNQDDQVMYSLSAGLTSGSYDTEFFGGNIVSLDGSGNTGTLHGGHRIGQSEIQQLKVAGVSKSNGSPRWLNWPLFFLGQNSQAKTQTATAATAAFVNTLDAAQVQAFSAGQAISAMTPAQTAAHAAMESAWVGANYAGELVQGLALAYHAAKSLIWADSYHVVFHQPTDDLMVSIMAAVQDLTRERIAMRAAGR